jgi:DnaJ-domain-containing protein 1
MKVPAEVVLTDGETGLYHLFVGNQQRLSDLINDDRAFLPVETSEGSISFLQKSAIARINLLERATPYHGNDPHQILGISPTIAEDELKEHYRRIARDCHPDRFQALGLPAAFIDFATQYLARVNDAYRRLMKQRRPGNDR